MWREADGGDVSNPMLGKGQRRRRDLLEWPAVAADVTAWRHCRLRSSPPRVRRYILVSETGSQRHGHARGTYTHTCTRTPTLCDWLSGERPAGKQIPRLIDGCKSTASNWKYEDFIYEDVQFKVITCLLFYSNLLT